MRRLKFITVSLLLGLFAGALGALFSHAFTLVTALRTENPWLLFLLPLGGVLTVFIYEKLKVTGIGTNNVLMYVKGKERISPFLMPAVFTGTLITHLLGGSAGREGAALQMGGGAAALLSKKFNLNVEESRIASICGMSAFFSALFGTPLGAAVFGVEVVFSKKQSLKALMPALISSFTAFFVAHSLLAHAERFNLNIPQFSAQLLVKTITVALFASAVCIFFLFCLHKSEKLFRAYFKNPYIRIVFGAILIIALTLIEGSREYNGGGMDIVERIFETSQVKNEAFILKLVFTCITVAAGFKGGEIVPTFFIGATFGGAFALTAGLPAPFGAAVGMAVLFSGATNCPLATVFICCEMFGIKGILYFALASFISFLLTGKRRLYNV